MTFCSSKGTEVFFPRIVQGESQTSGKEKPKTRTILGCCLLTCCLQVAGWVSSRTVQIPSHPREIHGFARFMLHP